MTGGKLGLWGVRGVSDRAQIHPRAAFAPARPDHAHDPEPRARPTFKPQTPSPRSRRTRPAVTLSTVPDLVT